ncbi:hypothetical protein VST7929_01064 [Vibrio stylophorae]|uniref:Insulinase family protein n=1 Tax=Vibrio stylophorae TaxID=659351 RepID=A0ABM8ZSD0_9VIBR|nr:M16 family metallopeptidase [Vibrio stylophorae]CAH0533202.1 hypothetical protein VST7929_01064 [Vibrio stylophorae]
MKYTSLLLAACLALAGCQQLGIESGIGQHSALQDAPLAKRADMVQGQLANGMRYIFVHNDRPSDRVSLQLIVHAGSLDEADDQQGIAHLVEHMAFNGTTDFPANTLIEHQESLGMVFGRDVNAMTEYYTTSYFLHLPNNSEKMMDEGFRMLSQQASALVFDQAELEKERPVVEEEWRRGRNMMARLGSANRKILLAGSRFGERDPIGDMDLVRHVDASRIEAFWQDWYHPNNMTLIVVGATSQREIETMLNRYFAPLEAKTLPARPDLKVTLDNTTRIEVIADPEITTEVLSFNFRQQEAQAHTQGELRAQLLNQMAIQVLNKRLREQYQVPSDAVSKMIMMAQPLATDYRNNRLMALLVDQNYQAAIDEAFMQLSRFAAHGFSQSDLDTVRQEINSRYQQMADGQRDTTNGRVMMSIFNRLRTQAPITDADEYAAVVAKLTQSITLDEINAQVAKMVVTQNPLVIAQIKPEHQSALPTAAAIDAAWQKAKANPPAATKAIEVVDRLMSDIPAPANIIAHEVKEGAQVWTLANGTQVWFLQSDDTPNQLMVRYQGWGGSQHLPKELRRSAYQLRHISKFGYGGLNSDQLAMINAPYPNRLMTFITQDSHGFIGSSDKASFENLLQNLYLQVTKPQTDEALWKATQQLLERGIEGRLTSAEGQFNTAIDEVRYVNNPMLLTMTKEELAEINTTKLMQAWQLLFGDATGHQLIVVGNAEPEYVIGLAQRYIGQLPVKTGAQAHHYAPVKLPAFAGGRHAIHIAAGKEPMGVTSLIFNRAEKYSVETENQVGLLSRIIANRMRESLREAAGGVYTVRFGIRLDRERDQAYGMVSYSHDPKRGDELKAMALAELATIQKEGVSQQELDEVIAQSKQSLVADNIGDRQRMTWLKDAAQYGDSMDPVADYVQWLDIVTPTMLNSTMRRVLNTENWIDATLVPAPAK